MNKVNEIQKSILELEGGKYQKLMDAYLYKKYAFPNIEPYGAQVGTDKTVKGIPDTYVRLDNQKYVFIMYGTHQKDVVKKLTEDIKNCLEVISKQFDEDEIDQIICCYTAPHVSPENHKKLYSLSDRLTLIGLSEVSYDLYYKYPRIAHDFLSISITTNQILDEDEFIQENDKNGFSTSLDMPLLCREKELSEMEAMLKSNKVIVVSGQSGIGKTRFSIEVVKSFAKKEALKVKYIKNNGEPLYDEINYYFSDEEDFIVLIDDANQLVSIDHLLRLACDSTRKHKFYIVITVRDYAKDHLCAKIKNTLQPKIYELSPLKDDNIIEILKNNLGIINDTYLKRICEIAKGNVRIAIMAGVSSLGEGKFENLHNIFYIYDTYFHHVIENRKKSQIITAALIAFFDRVRLDCSSVLFAFAKECGIAENDVVEFCHELSVEEIVDVYEDLAVKFNNQNLADYLLYYVFIKEKWLKLSDITLKNFPNYRGKIIHLFNTIGSLFYAEENIEYLVMQAQLVWKIIKNDSSKAEEFIDAFHNLIPEESFAYMNDKISHLPLEYQDFSTFDFEKTKNNKRIISKLLNWLSQCKNGNHMETGVDLIIKHLAKNTATPMDYYFLFSDELSIDRDSHRNSYSNDYLLLEKLYTEYKNSCDINLGYCILFLISANLKFEFDGIESSHKKNQINFYRFGLSACEGVFKLRKLSIDILFELSLNSRLIDQARKIMLSYHCCCNSDGDKIIFAKDIQAFAQKFELKNEDSFLSARIYYHFYELCVRHELPLPQVFEKWRNHAIFNIYVEAILGERVNYGEYDIWEKRRREKIEKIITKYNKKDIIALFDGVNELPHKDHNWEEQTGIETILLFLPEEDYWDVLSYALQRNVASISCSKPLVNRLYKIYGFNNTMLKFQQLNNETKTAWIRLLVNEILDSDITNDVVDLILTNLITDENNVNIAYSLTFETIAKINSIIHGFSKRYLSLIVTAHKDSNVCYDIAEWAYVRENGYKAFLELCDCDKDLVKKLYLRALSYGEHFDYNGNLLEQILQDNPEFLFEVADCVIKNNFIYSKNPLKYLLNFEKHVEYIDNLIKYLLNQDLFSTGELLKAIWLDSKSNKVTILEKQRKCVFNLLEKNESNNLYLEVMLESLEKLPQSDRKDIIVWFCNKNSSFDLFKNCPFFPSSYSWSGSEIPILEEKIKFLEDIKRELRGGNFIEHRAYLSDWIMGIRGRIDDVLLKEFLENQ